MVTDTPQPQETKRWLVEQRLRVLATESRQDFVRDLMLGPTGLPDHWLTEQQRAFLILGPDEPLTAATRRTGADLLNQVIYLGERLIPAIIDDHAGRRALDPDARERAPALIRDLLFLNCPAWPSPDSGGLIDRLRPAVDTALADRGNQQVIREDQPPADQRDHDERMTVYATRNRATFDLYKELMWLPEKIRIARIAASLAAAVIVTGFYVGLFLLLRHADPDMSPRDATLVLASVAGGTVSGTGLGLLVTRGNRNRSSGEDPPRPENR
jgi:hypothetical protein